LPSIARSPRASRTSCPWAALQELGSDLIGEAYVTATVTVWDEGASAADEKLRLVEKVIQGRDFTCIAETVNAVELVVYDPSNYAQNVLQAARALQQINNQVTSLHNETQMLLNQTRNLTNLPYSSLQAIDQSIQRTQQLLNQAQRIAYDINQIDQAFQRSYPQSYSVSTPSQQLVGDAQTRWQNSLAAYQDALRVQATVVQSLDSRAETNGLVSSSQSAVGILQANQAGNQLIALQTRRATACLPRPTLCVPGIMAVALCPLTSRRTDAVPSRVRSLWLYT
jgi:P-type conjugative transfer protein TrbJ